MYQLPKQIEELQSNLRYSLIEMLFYNFLLIQLISKSNWLWLLSHYQSALVNSLEFEDSVVWGGVGRKILAQSSWSPVCLQLIISQLTIQTCRAFDIKNCAPNSNAHYLWKKMIVYRYHDLILAGMIQKVGGCFEADL